ncbi:MAG: hypothetical protein Q7S33_01960 [Nanoarchaeota archaeon]|nr:hypothetical protein [Nanoarchaeota archaeon]
MNSKAILVTFIAVLAVFLAGLVSAGELANGVQTTFNDVELNSISTTMAGFAGETVPVRISFNALNDAEDVKVKVWMEGYRSDVTASSGRFNLIKGSTYTKLLSLQLPSDLKTTNEEYNLYVDVISSSDRTENVYTIQMQRESYELNVLSVDYPLQVSAGDVVPVSVVTKNTGMQKADDGYVSVSVAGLGISSKSYFGDLVPIEDSSTRDSDRDSVQSTVYLNVPENAQNGVYEMTVKVYNQDGTTTLNRVIKVEGSSATSVLAAVKNQDISAGETKTYDLILVNSGKDVKVYDIQTLSSTALSVSAPVVVSVAPESSKTVQISVTASKDAQPGAYTFSAEVDGKQIVFGANVTEGKVSTSVVTLTVVLVIVFVVLLVVLIVLLTRKEKPTEEVETSYY